MKGATNFIFERYAKGNTRYSKSNKTNTCCLAEKLINCKLRGKKNIRKTIGLICSLDE
jgi:hypothetical protein